jgi:PAS domain S-box-containing protein
MFTEAELYRTIFDHVPDVTVFVFDEELRYVLAAGAALQRAGWDPEEMLGRTPSDLLPAEEATELEDHFRAVLHGETRLHEHGGLQQDDVFWFSTISPLSGRDGTVVGGVIVSRDMAGIRRLEESRQHLAESARASTRRADAERWRRERLQFLIQVNHALSATVDRRDVMRVVTRVAVPRLGDWCSIHVLFDPGDKTPEVEVAHVDPAMVKYARELLERFPYDPNGLAGVPHVIRTGQAEFLAEISDELLGSLDIPDEALEIVRKLQLRSVITVPLIKRSRVIGAMQFVRAGTEGGYEHEDLTLAEAMAGRVASALDNHRLLEQQKEIAQTLQRSLLPDRLPEIPGIEYGVAYRAGAEAAEVGGDFYDLFEIDDDRYAVVIGDVCGSGTRAAALTSLARHNLRSNAWRGDGPAKVLTHLNDAIRRTASATFCTLIYGELRPGSDGAVLTLANGGHPPPIVVPSKGDAWMMQPMGPLAGAIDVATFREEKLRIGPGDTIVLFTDGVTDLPPPHALAEDDLLAMVEEAVRSTIDPQRAVVRLLEDLDARTPFSGRQDDVALLVLRANS